ncbi:cobalamin B12-binding domain-containing protein [Streptomyces sp. S1A]|uniref:MerR family transcriptional regulator n=1 Tax=Streptomyces sp. ICN903 TaxID=2964654 RepID=UPI001EDB896B|nr:MerR family transcriptional regulator [Streptomyces sp. ICN903]MCG3040471.1 cobalamin B12-binding domain-containing protein [Streptomyces sp. ICN903]
MAGAPETDDRTPGQAGLSTGAVARRLGVAPTTLRSWDRRYGLGPSVREDGRHRRWSPRDIAVLEAMCRLTASGVPPAEAARQARAAASPGPAAPTPVQPAPGEPAVTAEPAPPAEPAEPDEPASSAPARAGGGNTLPVGSSVSRECRGLARAAVRLDAPALDDLLDRAIAAHGVAGAWEEVIMPTLRAAGRKWVTSGERYVEVEHLLSWHVSSALRRVAARPLPASAASPAPSAPVLLACAPDETHTLPLEVLAAALAEHGVGIRMFGASVPAGAMEEAVRRTGPSAVVLWSQTRRTADPALVRRVRATAWGVRGARVRPAVLVAGPGWRGLRLPGIARPRGLRDALDLLTASAGDHRA